MSRKQAPIRKILGFPGSVHFAMVLLIAGMAVMAIGTFVESSSGLDVAQSTVYRTGWFDFFLLLIGVNLVAAVIIRIPIKRHQWSFVLTHFSIILLLAGAWTSRTFGFEGHLAVLEGHGEERINMPTSEVVLSMPSAEGRQTLALPVPDTVFLAGEVLQQDGPETVGVRILAYEPYAHAETRLVDDPAGPAGIEFRVFSNTEESSGWIVADHRLFRQRDLGPLTVEIVHLRSAEDLRTRAQALPGTGGRVTIIPEEGGPDVVLVVPDDVDREVELGGDRTAKITRFLESARVADGILEESPGGSINPAACVEIRRGDVVEQHTVFGLFPDFNLTKGHEAGALVHDVRLEMSGAVGQSLVSILVGPAGELLFQVTTEGGRGEARPLTAAVPVPLSPIPYRLVLERFVAAARPETVVEPAEPDDEHSLPCLQLEVTHDDASSTIWVPRGGSQKMVLAGVPLDIVYRRALRTLPFIVELEEFKVGRYPGSNRPATYESHVVLRDRSSRIPAMSAVVAMNRPIDYMGFRLFQSSYTLGESGAPDTTVLAVSYDPGVPIVYTAFVLLIVGIGWYMTGDTRRRRRRSPGSNRLAARPPLPSSAKAHELPPRTARLAAPALKRSSVSGLLSLVLLPAFFLAATGRIEAAPVGGGGVPLEATEGWALQADGRVKPLAVHAREMALAITGRSSHDGLSALEIFWGYNLDAAAFRARDYIRIDSKILKEAMGFDPDRRRFSFDVLMGSAKLQEIVTEALELQGEEKKLTPLQGDAVGAYEKMELVADLMEGRGLVIVPGATADAKWRTPGDLFGTQVPDEHRLLEGMGALAASYEAGDARGFEAAAESLTGYLRMLSPGAYPNEATIANELSYLHLNAFGTSWKIYLLSFLTMLLFGLGAGRKGRRVGLALLAGGLLFHTIGIGLRWRIAGHAPVSNMYESLVFMAWGVTAIGITLEGLYRKGYFALSAGLMGTLALAFAENLPIDSSINPLVPVLANTSWLSIHVMTIMLSYSAFALAMAMGHVVVVIQLFRPGKTELLRTLSQLLYRILQVGVLFLAAGIVFGAIWANRSWGRYWGWDPKETWSLITFFAYLGLVHARFAGWLHHFGMAIWSILCFLSVIMTYYGVNFILGAGLHSYGFSSGGTLYAMAYLVAEVGIITAATLRYYGAVRSQLLGEIEAGSASI